MKKHIIHLAVSIICYLTGFYGTLLLIRSVYLYFIIPLGILDKLPFF